jgi:tetratricopeptide (TPR) repeat protein
VANLLYVEGLPESLRTMILTKAEGNPFFVEEVVRSLIDAGVVVQEGEGWRATREIAHIDVPDTLSAVLNTRLDALSDTSKRVAQTASVLGREFDYDTLASVYEPLSAVNGALTDLQRRGLIREKSRRPTRVFTFKHGMTQEAAYASLLLKNRRALHKQVAEALTRIAPEQVEEIARHYLAARERTLALPWLVQAGERAAHSYSTPEAVGYFTEALDILEDGVPDIGLARRAYEGRGGVFQLRFEVDRAQENYRAMRAYAVRYGDASMQVSALNKTAMVESMFRGDDQTASTLLDEASAIAEDADCQPGLAEGCMIRCAIHTGKAEFDEAYTFLDRAARIGKELDAEEPRLFGMTHIANTLILMTEYDRAWPHIQETVALAEELGNKQYLAELKTFAVPNYLMRNGDLDAAAEELRAGTEMASLIGHAAAECAGASQLGKIATMQGRFEEGIALNEQALKAGRATGAPFLESLALCTLGSSYLQISARLHQQAVDAHEEALALMQRPHGLTYGAMNWCEVGFCAMEIGKLDDARKLFERGLNIQTAPMYVCRPNLHVGAGFVALQQGRGEDAKAHATLGRAFAEERQMRHFSPYIALLEAHLSAAEGDADTAVERFEEAEALAEKMGLRPTVWQACAAAADVLDTAGRRHEAEEKRRRAQEVVDDIASIFADAALRDMYVEDAVSKLNLN